MLLTERLTWENTEQELVECDAINLIYELRALILAYWLTTLWRLANIPRRMWKAADMFRLRLFFPELIWWRGIEHNWESGVKFHCAQTSKKIAFSTHFRAASPPRSGSVAWKTSYWPRSPWKEWVCCCVNRGNDLLTLCVCVHCRVYCPVLMFTV